MLFNSLDLIFRILVTIVFIYWAVLTFKSLVILLGANPNRVLFSLYMTLLGDTNYRLLEYY